MEQQQQQPPPQLSRLVYNPYVLHLLHTKMRYLLRLVARHYKRCTENELTTSSLMDYVVLNNLYAEVLTRDLDEMLGAMRAQRFPIELAHCHYEFYLFRFSQVFRLPMEPLTELFGSRYYKCESKLLRVVGEQELCRASLQIALRGYMESFYLHVASAEKAQRRVQLFFHVKETMEAEVVDEVLDKKSTRVLIRYDDELVATLFYIHLLEELLCLHESEANQIHHHQSISGGFKFVERNLYKPILTPIVIDASNDDSHLVTLVLLQKLMHTMCTTYREQVVSCVRYTSVEGDGGGGGDAESSSSWFSGFTSPTSTKKISSSSEDRRHHLQLNNEYILERPLNEAVTVAISTVSMTTIKSVVGKSEFYGGGGGGGITPKKKYQYPVTLPIEYLTFTENRRHYELFLYRLVFELRLREGHRCGGGGSGKACYLCTYFKRNDVNTRISRFLQICAEPVESPECSTRLSAMKDDLSSMVLDLTQPILLYGYKVLANVITLFDHLPLANGATFPLTDFLNPCKLVDDLSESVKLPRLEAKMTEVTELCTQKAGFHKGKEHEVGVVVTREQDLAMDIELVRLISVAINSQETDIVRYERSTTPLLLSLESTTMAIHVAKLLRRIYVAHVDVLCQLIAERHGSVKFNQL